jgi:DNA-directed RNA polymerase specialized sigma24 family protein
MHNGDFADSTEGELLAAIAAGSRTALYRLHFLYFPRLARFFARLTATPAADIIEQLIADTMWDVWRTSTTMASEATARISIMRVAWARARERVPESSIPGLPGVTEKTQSLSEALGRMKLLERAVVDLVHSAHSRQEIADILSMSCEYVDGHLARARFALHDWLSSRYPAESKARAIGDQDHGVQRFGGRQAEMLGAPPQ